MMLDPVIDFLKSVLSWVSRIIGGFLKLLLSPFVWLRNFYGRAHMILKVLLAILILFMLVPYGWFFWNAAWIRNYDLKYADKLGLNELKVSAGEQISVEGDSGPVCGRSGIVDVVAELLDFNVNQNTWVSATLPYRLGLFGVAWDATPWMDNKASFQRGVHRSVRSTAIELQETLGRVRGTSERDEDLNTALSNIQISEFNWYLGLNPPGFKQTSWASYRRAKRAFGDYNSRLAACKGSFDARADNLSGLMDRIAKDIGSTTAVIKDRSEQYNGGWFDFRADNTFLEAHGQLYGYLGILKAAKADFQDIVERRAIGSLWDNMLGQLENAIALDPWIISNGKEDGMIMPTHLTTMGFYILRVRTNLTEMRDVLKN